MNDLPLAAAALGEQFALYLSALSNNIEPAQARLLWQDIAAQYGATQRAYHDLNHLRQLFVQFEQVKHDLHAPSIIALALYYHDVIYEPSRSDNELRSAEYAFAALSPYLRLPQCQHVYALIMMTATHQLGELSDPDKVSDAAYMLDMDLSILSTPWHEYQQYAQAVRQEYHQVPLADYRLGRTQVLTALLSRSRLYLTNYYYQRLEIQARDNIKREISLLLNL